MTSESKHILVVLGTRPEAIKLAPLIIKAREDARFKTTLCTTGQHDELAREALATFDIVPDFDLGIMRPNQTLDHVCSAALTGVSDLISQQQPEWVIVQGDAMSAFSGALAGHFGRCGVVHVEAGLRSGDKTAPFPEEANRRAISVLADIHYAPTPQAKTNLLAEGISDKGISVTGNTAIDALHLCLEQIRANSHRRQELETRYRYPLDKKPLVLVTAHRRENFGLPMLRICHALMEASKLCPSMIFLFLVHPNPNVSAAIYEIMGIEPSWSKTAQPLPVPSVPNLILMQPVGYMDLAFLLSHCQFVVTDSGGLQEEAPAIGKPVLILRDVTERPEAVELGVSRVVGTTESDIVQSILQLATDDARYRSMAQSVTCYGDGNASGRILKHLVGQRSPWS